MITPARVASITTARFYLPDGTALVEVPYKDTRKGMRAATIADARKLGALPSVTTILQLLDKPQLNAWKAEQVALAVLTTPRQPDESIDAFVHRVLQVEEAQREEAALAAALGTRIHEAIRQALAGEIWDTELDRYVAPVLDWASDKGEVVWLEKVLLGDGYAGRGDALLHDRRKHLLRLVDFKTTSSLPEKESWTEHRLQTSAYAGTLMNTADERIITANVYIHSKNPGAIAPFEQTDWVSTYTHGFVPLVRYWQWLMEYVPPGSTVE